MKTVEVLTLFVVLFIHEAATLTCKQVLDFSDSTVIDYEAVDQTCTQQQTKCSRPVLFGDVFDAAETWGCVDSGCTASGNCLLCSDDNCNVRPMKCKQGASDASDAADLGYCNDKEHNGEKTPTVCLRPARSYTWPAAGQLFECGLKSDCTDASTCIYCESPDMCNDPANVESNTPDFKCFGYTHDGTVFKKTDATECKGYDTTATQCNKPKAAATDGTAIYNGGCGPCAAGKESVCETCTGSSCNDEIQCYTNEANDASAACPGATQCKRPRKGYDGYDAAATWGCGGCNGAANCVECTGDKCNTAVVGKVSKCFQYAWVTDHFEKTAATDCNRGDIDEIKCNMPKAAATDGTGIYNSGCGPCDASKDSVCADCDSDSCNVIPDCYTDEANDDAKAALCLEAKCKRPKKSYGGYDSAVAFGCGGCDGADNCVECTEDKCNKAVVSKMTKCFTYKWDTDKFLKSDVSADCDQGESDIACNKPKDAEEETDYTTLTGCGPCKENEKCEVCSEEECNSAVVNTATALFLALFYTMM